MIYVRKFMKLTPEAKIQKEIIKICKLRGWKIIDSSKFVILKKDIIDLNERKTNLQEKT